MTALRCVALNCTLKADGPSNTELLMRQVLDGLGPHGVQGELQRVAGYDVHPGVLSEAQGPGDQWPDLRTQIMESDILVLGTPVWLGGL